MTSHLILESAFARESFRQCDVLFIYLRIILFGNNPKKSKFHSRRNWEQIEVGECLLSFGAGSSVLQFAIQKYKD
jgi:hypothetical protein